MHTLRRRSALLLALVVAAGLAAGCTADSASDAGAPDLSNAGASVPDLAGGAAGNTDTASLAVPGAPADVAAEREIITTGSATVIAEDPRATAQRIGELAETAGGRVESRSESAGADDEGASASLTIRVPADRVTATVDALEELGEVRDVSIKAVDVTATAVDLDARIQALTASTQRLETLMTEATTTEDLLAAEQELTARQADLEGLQAQRTAIADQVEMSTVQVTVLAVESAPELRAGGFLGGLQNGWAALLMTFNGIVVVLGALVPWVLVIGVVVLLVRWIARRTSRRRAGGTPPRAPGADDPTASGDGPGGRLSAQDELVKAGQQG